MGRLGKSSLAARVANRLPRHRAVVVFKTYKSHAVLDRVLDALPARTKQEFGKRWATAVQQDPAVLGDALGEILEGPCSAHDPDGGKQPMLLVIDDLEQILTAPEADHAVTVQDNYVPVLRAIIEAFTDVRSASLLLMTSRYRFELTDAQGQDLTRRIAHIPLPPMNKREQAKQRRAEAGDNDAVEAGDNGAVKAQASLLDRCIMAGRGNPGLQSRLTKATLTDAKAAAAAIDEVERFHASGKTPTGDIGDFFQQLTLEVYQKALTGDEAALVRAAIVFELPVPEEIVVAAGEAVGVDAIDLKLSRLEGLGLIDRFALEDGAQASLMVNALARPLFEALSTPDQQHVARATVTPLADAWRDPGGGLPYGPWSLELARVAELAGDVPALLADAAEASGWWLLRTMHDARGALEVAEQGIAALQAAGLSASINLLRLAAEAAQRLGEVSKQETFLEQGLAREAADPRDQAMLWVGWAERLARKGQIEQAETWLKKARAAFTDIGDVRLIAVTQGRIADILVNRGQYDEALRIYGQEAIPVLQQLGDVRSVAVAQGKIADILVDRGQPDEALRIRQEEELPVYRQLGDVREIAITQGKIADILVNRGQYDEALRIRQQEELPVLRQLGDVREIAITQGLIADILVRRGQYDEALRIRQQEELSVYRQLGEIRSIAITQGKIADILVQRGQYDEALRNPAGRGAPGLPTAR
jgi:tetratricopeptide (TPR) repeat protein